MRQIVLDTETTGLEAADGHRLIEIGAVELVDRRLSGRHFHYYLNPQRDIDDGALADHGITSEFLQDKKLFADIAQEFLEFIDGAELIIHNAAFDLGFLDLELALLGEKLPRRPVRIDTVCSVLDTLSVARELHPGQRNSLDALCRRYEIDDSSRTLHGALLDAKILAEVYLAMTGGQTDLGLSFIAQPLPERTGLALDQAERPAFRVVYASDEELARHQARLGGIRETAGHCVWLEM